MSHQATVTNFRCILFTWLAALTISLAGSSTSGQDWKELSDSATAMLYADKHDSAIALFRKAISIAETKPDYDDSKMVKLFTKLATCHYYKADYAEAIRVWGGLVASIDTLEVSDHWKINILQNLAISCRESGDFTRAESLLLRAVTMVTKMRDEYPAKYAHVTSELGWLYVFVGKYAMAEPLLNEALSLRLEHLGPEDQLVALTHLHLGQLYLAQGRLDEAERHQKEALRIREEQLGENDSWTSQSVNCLADVYLAQKRYGLAKQNYQRSLEINTSVFGDSNYYLAYSYNGLARVYHELQQLDSAEYYYIAAIDIVEQSMGGNHPDITSNLVPLAGLYFDTDRLVLARKALKRAIQLQEDLYGTSHPNVADSYGLFARVYTALGKTDSSVAAYDRMLSSRRNLIKDVFSYASEEQKLRYVRGFEVIDPSLVALATESDDRRLHIAAMEMVLKGKGLVIEALAAERMAAICSDDVEIQQAIEDHRSTCEAIANLTIISLANPDQTKLNDSLRILYNSKERIEKTLSDLCADARITLESGDFSLSDIIDALPDNATLLEYVKYKGGDSVHKYKPAANPEERYALFVLDQTVNLRIIDIGPAATIDSLVSECRTKLLQAPSTIFRGYEEKEEAELREITGQLYAALLEPILKHLPEDRDLIMVLDGDLNLIPFEILSGSDGTYLIENHAISYLATGRDLLATPDGSERTGADQRVVVITDPAYDLLPSVAPDSFDTPTLSKPLITMRNGGDSPGCLDGPFSRLAGTRLEGERLTQALAGQTSLQTSIFSGIDASEGLLKNLEQSPRVLHLATHGFFCNEIVQSDSIITINPLLRSGLVLAGANIFIKQDAPALAAGDDGILTSLEASGLNLVGTELVVLSACQTGVGQVVSGEGVFGLQRAFQIAGAKSIIMSMIAVPDKSTATLIDRFYNNWVSGQSKSSALRNASLSMLYERRQKIGIAHPLYWGGFIYVGNPK